MLDFILPMYFFDVYSKLNYEQVNKKVDIGLEDVFLQPITKYLSSKNSSRNSGLKKLRMDLTRCSLRLSTERFWISARRRRFMVSKLICF